MHVRELFDLSGKSAIVTGGGSGLGRQMAEALAEMGSDLVICARNVERCEQAARELSELGVRVVAMRCDVRNRDEIVAVVERACEEFGRIDTLVNSAGAAWGAAPEETSLEGWQKLVDVNLTGVFLFCQAVGRVMIEQGGGKIVNVASVTALIGAPQEVVNAIAYSATKGGVVAFSRDLACKWARHRIYVNTIAPGWFPSDMSSYVLDHAGEALIDQIPLRRFGGGDDLKGAIVFLASAASDYVTGQVLVVDGGQTAW